MERADKISLIVGLGNPGSTYAHTRHNAGFATIDVLAERLGVNYWKSEAGCLVATSRCEDNTILLAKPQSFMNNSGGPVSKLCTALALEPAQLLVIHDELDIPAGDVRIKFGGGTGGHNGIKSIIDKLGSPHFNRLRIGIGRPPGRMDPADFVLRELKGNDACDFAISIQLAADAAESCLKIGVIAARNHFNALHKSASN